LSDANKLTIELIKRLSVAIGVSGYTGNRAIHDVLIREMTPLVDRVERDRVGNVVGFKKGVQGGDDRFRRKIMLAAHLDEIGAMVTKIDRGFLHFTEVGGLDNRVLMGQEVLVHAQRDLPGIIASVPPHLLPTNRPADAVDHTDMLIDVGLPPQQVKKLVQVGDVVSFVREPVELQNGLVSGKALDNRASLAAVLLCLQYLQPLQHQWDVYAVATADEEWSNHLGARTQAYAIRPDVALAIDVTFADVDENDIKLDGGPTLTIGPSNHPVLFDQLVRICRNLELKYQTEVVASGVGTDAFGIEVSRSGIPTLLISIPSRNMHSPVEIVHPKDIERAGRLMAHFIAGLNERFVEKLIPG
jgi:endoglucanase